MSGMDFSLAEWRDSYEQAEIANWKDEGITLSDWPLAQFLCGMVANSETIRKDPESMQAAMNVLDSEGYNDGFSAEFFTGVMKSANGKTGNSFEELCREHAEENCHPGFVSDGDFESWYVNNAIGDGEVCAEADSGGTLFWFKKNQW